MTSESRPDPEGGEGGRSASAGGGGTDGDEDDGAGAEEKTTTTTVTFLTLGDGDFTFSLDFARFLLTASRTQPPPPPKSSSTESSQGEAASSKGGAAQLLPPPLGRTPASFHLVATGFDSADELVKKYRDAPFVLRQLRNVVSVDDRDGGGQREGRSLRNRRRGPRLRVSIRHGVNAVGPGPPPPRAEDEKKVGLSPPSGTREELPATAADCVVFNHPHLGTEDARLHSRFLCHLFHSVRHRWLVLPSAVKEEEEEGEKVQDHQPHQQHRPSDGDQGRMRTKKEQHRPPYPKFHLTLAGGQFERWDCLRAAERHGMELVDRSDFRPPQVQQQQEPASGSGGVGGKSYYTLRRHQTGKSFQSRAAGRSETFTFARKEDVEESQKTVKDPLYWKPTWLLANSDAAEALPESQQQQQEAAFPCPFCDRTFREERSVRAHVRSKHPDGGDRKRKHLGGAGALLVCPHCRDCSKEGGGDDGPQKSNQALRTFESEQALQDHVRAKHTALHATIKPDWCSKEQQQQRPASGAELSSEGSERLAATTGDCCNGAVERKERDGGCFGECDICGLRFRSEEEESEHFKLFEPGGTPTGAVPAGAGITDANRECYRCGFCAKSFRERRAQLQHENFCANAAARASVGY